MNHHPLRDRKVLLNEKASDPQRNMVCAGEEFWIEDWYVNMDSGVSEPLIVPSNWAEKWYLERAEANGLPKTELVYGKIGALGHLVHVSELGELVDA